MEPTTQEQIVLLKAEAWDLARQIDAINEKVRPFSEQIQSLQKQIAVKMIEISTAEQSDADNLDK